MKHYQSALRDVEQLHFGALLHNSRDLCWAGTVQLMLNDAPPIQEIQTFLNLIW